MNICIYLFKSLVKDTAEVYGINWKLLSVQERLGVCSIANTWVYCRYGKLPSLTQHSRSQYSSIANCNWQLTAWICILQTCNFGLWHASWTLQIPYVDWCCRSGVAAEREETGLTHLVIRSPWSPCPGRGGSPRRRMGWSNAWAAEQVHADIQSEGYRIRSSGPSPSGAFLSWFVNAECMCNMREQWPRSAAMAAGDGGARWRVMHDGIAVGDGGLPF